MGGMSNELTSPTALGGPAASRRSLLKGGQSALMGLPPEAALRDTRVRQDYFRHLVTGRTMESIEAERTGRKSSWLGTNGPQAAATALSVVFPPAGAALQAGLAIGDQIDRTYWGSSRSAANGLQAGLKTVK